MAKKRAGTKPQNDLGFQVKTTNTPNVVRVTHCDVRPGWEQWYLLRSDAHWDNPDSKWDLQKEHLDEAVRRKAGVLDFGDLFCAMQGRFDKRSSKSKVRPEHQTDDYLDALVKTAADFYEPYAHLWVMQGVGNHEASIKQRHETCLIDRWAQTLRDRTGAVVPVTGYTGWVSFMFNIYETQRTKVRLWHTHGYGGGGPVTKDMIQRSRMLAYVQNADIICSGHVHDQWVTKDMRLVLNAADQVEQRACVTVKCPTYKDEYKTGVGGWHVATGKPPKPIGAYWLRFFLSRSKTDTTPSKNSIKFEIREAVE
jgi:hypothetical protein